MIIVSLTILVVAALWFYPRGNRTQRLLFFSLVWMTVLGMAACSPSEVQMIDQVSIIISGLIPIVAAMGSALLPAEAAAINVGATALEAVIKELSNLVAEYNSNPTETGLQAVTAAFSDIQKNLDALETAAQVKDNASRLKINAIISGAAQSLALIEASLTAKSGTKIATAAATAATTQTS